MRRVEWAEGDPAFVSGWAALLCGIAGFLVATNVRAEEPSRPPSEPPPVESKPVEAARPAPAVPPAPGPPVAPPAGYPGYYPMPPIYVQDLTFESSPEAELQMRYGNTWRTVCTGPCRTRVYVGAEYRVSGDGVTTSKTFVAQPTPFPVALHADPGSSGAKTAGLVLTPIAGTLMLFGIVGVALSGETSSSSSSRRTQTTAATAILLVGGGALALGIVLITSNRTRLDFGPAYASAPPSVRLAKGLELGVDGLRF